MFEYVNMDKECLQNTANQGTDLRPQELGRVCSPFMALFMQNSNLFHPFSSINSLQEKCLCEEKSARENSIRMNKHLHAFLCFNTFIRSTRLKYVKN